MQELMYITVAAQLIALILIAAIKPVTTEEINDWLTRL